MILKPVIVIALSLFTIYEKISDGRTFSNIEITKLTSSEASSAELASDNFTWKDNWAPPETLSWSHTTVYKLLSHLTLHSWAA